MSGYSSKLTDLLRSVSRHGLFKEGVKEKEELTKFMYCYPGVLKDEKGQRLEYPLRAKEKRIKHLSAKANSVAAYSAKVLSTTLENLWLEFVEARQGSGDHLDHVRPFLEHCCFRAFAILTQYEDHLHDDNFRRYTFDCMVAWEAPSVNQPNYQEENYEPRSKEEEDDDASLFFTDLMPLLVDVQDTVGTESFVRIAPRIMVVADIVSAHVQFEMLTASMSGRMPYPAYDKYLSALEKSAKDIRAKNEPSFIHNLPISPEEHVMEMDGMSQTVIQHVGSKAVSGRLTLTDYALYFEPSSIMSYRDAFKFNLDADLRHEVFPDLSGPWGSRIFDKAITYRNSTLSTPIVFEFPDLFGSARRDYWLSLIQEVIDCHMFIRKHNLDGPSQAEARARTIVGVVRLQAIRDCTQLLPSKPGALLVFNSAQDFLPRGDLILEALANTIKEAVLSDTEEEAKDVDWKDGRIRLPNSAIRFLQCLHVWRDPKPSEIVYKVKPGELTTLEKAVQESGERSKVTQKAKALEEEVKLDGFGTNVALSNELLRPVIAFCLWMRDVVSWNRPLESFHVFIILAYAIYRDWLGYILPFSLAAAGVFIIWLRATNKAAKYREIVVQSPSGGVSLEQVVTAQRAVSQIQGILQAVNVILLKIWALVLFVKPEASNLIVLFICGLALVFALLPFKAVVLAIHFAIFTSTFRNKMVESKLQRRLRELWHSIPPLPVRLVESEEEKKMREALQG